MESEQLVHQGNQWNPNMNCDILEWTKLTASDARESWDEYLQCMSLLLLFGRYGPVYSVLIDFRLFRRLALRRPIPELELGSPSQWASSRSPERKQPNKNSLRSWTLVANEFQVVEPCWQVPAGDENNLGPLWSMCTSSSAGPIVEPPKQGMSQD